MKWAYGISRGPDSGISATLQQAWALIIRLTDFSSIVIRFLINWIYILYQVYPVILSNILPPVNYYNLISVIGNQRLPPTSQGFVQSYQI